MRNKLHVCVSFVWFNLHLGQVSQNFREKPGISSSTAKWHCYPIQCSQGGDEDIQLPPLATKVEHIDNARYISTCLEIKDKQTNRNNFLYHNDDKILDMSQRFQSFRYVYIGFMTTFTCYSITGNISNIDDGSSKSGHMFFHSSDLKWSFLNNVLSNSETKSFFLLFHSFQH